MIVSLVVAAVGCSLVDDRPAQVASGPSTSVTTGAGADRGAGVDELDRGPTVARRTPDPLEPASGQTEPSDQTEPANPGRAVDPGATPVPSPTPAGTVDASSDSFAQWPPLCLHLRRYLDTSVAMFSVSTMPELVVHLRSLRSILASIETSAPGPIAADARAVSIGLDGVASRLNPSAAVQEGFRLLLSSSGTFSSEADRLVAQGLARCGGSRDPVLSTQDGIRLLAGIQ